MKKCIRCKKSNLAPHNKSGYCTKCYPHSPKMLEYQKEKQREYHKNHPEKRREYNRRPEVRKHRREVYRKWISKPENRKRVRELKRNWMREQRQNGKI